MYDFIFQVPTKILFGRNMLNKLPSEIKKYTDNVMLVYGGGSIKKSGLYDKITSLLEENAVKYTPFGGVQPNPILDKCKEGIALAKEKKTGLILAVGGGSVIDTSKLIAAAVCTDADPWDIVLGKVHTKNALPIGTVLTLSATGSEMDTSSVITNTETRQKYGWGSFSVLPKFSVLDPSLTFSVSKYQTASGTADIMSHTMENYFSLGDGCYLQNRLAEGVLKTCIKYAPIAIEKPDDYEARANLMWAGSWAINGLLDSGKMTDWSVHAMEHELSAYNNITHGAGLAILTPRWLTHCLNDKTAPKIAEFGKNVFDIKQTGNVQNDAKSAIKALCDFFASIGIPAGLSELGYTKDVDFKEMAEKALARTDGVLHGFIDLKADDIQKIYEMSL